MKVTRKYAAALAVLTAGSVLYVSLPAHAIELDKVEVTFKREDTDARGHMPPPPQQGRPGEHMPPPPQGDPRGYMPQQGGPRGSREHMPPPQPAGDPRGFAPGPQRGPGPRDSRGYMPPEPPHHDPRGHMPHHR